MYWIWSAETTVVCDRAVILFCDVVGFRHMLQSCDLIDVIEMLTSLYEIVDYACSKFGTNQVMLCHCVATYMYVMA